MRTIYNERATVDQKIRNSKREVYGSQWHLPKSIAILSIKMRVVPVRPRIKYYPIRDGDPPEQVYTKAAQDSYPVCCPVPNSYLIHE